MDTTLTLIGLEYVFEKYNKELRQVEPCKPHILLKLRDNNAQKNVFIRKYVSEAAMTYTRKDLENCGLAFAIDILGRKTISCYSQEQEWQGRTTTQWNISQKQGVAPPPQANPQQPQQQHAPQQPAPQQQWSQAPDMFPPDDIPFNNQF